MESLPLSGGSDLMRRFRQVSAEGRCLAANYKQKYAPPSCTLPKASFEPKRVPALEPPLHRFRNIRGVPAL